MGGGWLNFLQSLLHAWDKCKVSLLLLFFFFFFGKHVLMKEKKIKPIASLVIESGANPGFKDRNHCENMPTAGRELNGGQLHHV